MTRVPRIASVGRRRFLQRFAASVAGLVALGVPKRSDSSTTGIEPYLGQIMLVSWNFPPKGWAFCNGQILPISQNQALFSILGTTYGGEGIQSFALPNLQNRVPIHVGQGPGLTNRALGEVGGETNHTLVLAEIPAHTHTARGASAFASLVDPAGRFPARNPANVPQYASTANAILSDVAVGGAGGSQPHTNTQPSLALNFVIALQGIFPTRS